MGLPHGPPVKFGRVNFKLILKKNNHSHTYNRHTGKTNLHKHKIDYAAKKKTCKLEAFDYVLTNPSHLEAEY